MAVSAVTSAEAPTLPQGPCSAWYLIVSTTRNAWRLASLSRVQFSVRWRWTAASRPSCLQSLSSDRDTLLRVRRVGLGREASFRGIAFHSFSSSTTAQSWALGVLHGMALRMLSAADSNLDNTDQWLQIDLLNPQLVVKIETQGTPHQHDVLVQGFEV